MLLPLWFSVEPDCIIFLRLQWTGALLILSQLETTLSLYPSWLSIKTDIFLSDDSVWILCGLIFPAYGQNNSDPKNDFAIQCKL